MGRVPCVPSPCGAGGSAWGHGGAAAPRYGMWDLDTGPPLPKPPPPLWEQKHHRDPNSGGFLPTPLSPGEGLAPGTPHPNRLSTLWGAQPPPRHPRQPPACLGRGAHLLPAPRRRHLQ